MTENTLLSDLIRRIKRNPVLVAALLAAGQAVLDGSPLRAAASILLGVVVRQATSPAAEVPVREAEAYAEGFVRGNDLLPD